MWWPNETLIAVSELFQYVLSIKFITTALLSAITFTLIISLFDRFRECYYRAFLRMIEWASISATDDEITKDDHSINGQQMADGSTPIDKSLIQRQWSESIGQKIAHIAENNRQSPEERLIIRTQNIKFDYSDECKIAEVLVTDFLELLTSGVESIIQDDVTSRFEVAQLSTWNLLSRSRVATAEAKISRRAYILWLFGVLFRYAILLPTRLIFFIFGLICLVTIVPLVAFIPVRTLRSKAYRFASSLIMHIAARSFSAIIRFHDRENRPTSGIVVANHTSPTDAIILGMDNVYALTGQKHGGLLGIAQKALNRAAINEHIWFERSDAKDRQLVQKGLRAHSEYSERLPILLFPEGTCINNTSVMLFKKGAFEITDVVHPIAMRYDNRLGDAFWAVGGYLEYFLSMMSSWAIVCDVWYLPPIYREQDESASEFAARCRRKIAQKCRIVDLEWNGDLKFVPVSEGLRDKQRARLCEYLLTATSLSEIADKYSCSADRTHTSKCKC